MANIEKRKDIKELLTGEQFKNEVARALPHHLTPDRFIRIALTALTKTPKLMQCTPESFFNSLLTLSQLGIEPDGRRAHLIPYGTACQLIIDYKGIVELVMRGGNVSNIHADVVCENDKFAYNKGEIQLHRIDFRQARGAVYAVYAICRFKDGTEKTEVMTRDEIEAIRKRSRAGTSGPWVTDWNEMAKKTVFRRLSKWLPLSSEERDALEKDDDQLPAIDVTYTDTPPEKGVKALESKIADPVEPEPEPDNQQEPQAEPQPDGETFTGVLAQTTKKDGKKNGKAYVKYGAKITTETGDVWLNTFSNTMGEQAEELKGRLVTVTGKKTQYGYDLLTVDQAETTAAVEPEPTDDDLNYNHDEAELPFKGE